MQPCFMRVVAVPLFLCFIMKKWMYHYLYRVYGVTEKELLLNKLEFDRKNSGVLNFLVDLPHPKWYVVDFESILSPQNID